MIAFKIKTFTKPMLFLAVLVCTLLNGAHASTCITAGRMDTEGWAPQFKSMHLLNEAGRVLVVKNKSELTQVKAVELKEAALLSVCDGNKSLTRGDDATIKGAVPAAKPGLNRFNHPPPSRLELVPSVDLYTVFCSNDWPA